MKIIENVVKPIENATIFIIPIGENIMEMFGYHIERLGVPCRNFCYHEVKHMEKKGNAKPNM